MIFWAFALVCALHSLCVGVAWIVYSNEELSRHATTQNSLAHAERLFKLTTRLNETDFFTDYRVCLTDSPKPFVCMRYVNTYQKQFVRLWDPIPDKTEQYPRFEQDCSYKITYAGSSVPNPVQLQYQFDVKQLDCKSKTSIVGGASFEAFGLGPQALTSCSTVDQFSNQYTITCNLPVLVPQHTSSQQVCVNFTILLMYEHYDAVSEILPDWSHKYPPMRSVLLNNQQFCTTTSRNVVQPKNKRISPVRAPSMAVNLPKDVPWYTGNWVWNGLQKPQLSQFCATIALPYNHSQCYHSTAHTNLLYEHVPGSATDAYRHSLLANKTRIVAPVNTARLTFPNIAGEDPTLTANKYTFQPIVYTGTAFTMMQNHQDAPKNTSKNALGVVDSGAQSQVTQILHNLTTDANHIYHFIGASHMRYNFDAVSEYFMGIDSLASVDRKHDSIALHNLKYNFISNSKHQSEFLQRLCRSLQNSTMYGHTTKYTIIFQTGAWDLSMGSVRRAIKDPFAMSRVMRVFQRIFDGSLQCGGLNKIVFLTSLPYPVCFDDSELECNGHRSFRSNVAIEALNTYLVSNMLRISQLPYSPYRGQKDQSSNIIQRPARKLISSPGTLKATQMHGVRETKKLHRFETAKKVHRDTSSVVIPQSALTASITVAGKEDKDIHATKHAANGIRLSIIDTYGIVYPRLLFNELGEIPCLNHYTCRVFIVPSNKTVLIQSPAGAAIVRSILTALSVN